MKALPFYGIVAIILILLLAAVLLSGCAGRPPEPVIVTKEVKVEVPVPCKADPGTRPALMDKDQVKAALAAAPTLDDRVKIVSEQLLLYLGWTPKVETALKGCQGPPDIKP